jgi:hypothetical protein
MPVKFDQKKTVLEWIPVRNLAVVWTEAQRPYKESWAKEIASNFDPEKFDPVKTMLPNGNGIHHICEGQHRVGAIRMLWGHDEKVPCLVAQESDPARAAEIFLDTNTNRDHVSNVAKFKVGVVAQRKEEVSINRIVQHCGYRVETGSSENAISAVNGLRFVYSKGAKTLDQTLSIIRKTWGGDPTAVSSPILRGYGAFICEFSEHIDWERLRSVMIKRGSPGKLMIDTTGLKEFMKCSNTTAMVSILLKTYNRGLPAAKHLKHKG